MSERDSVHKEPSLVWEYRSEISNSCRAGWRLMERGVGQVSEPCWGDGGGREGQAV